MRKILTNNFAEEYIAQTPRSSALFERANKVMPSGNTRDTVFFKPRPLYVAKANGCKIVDVDGNVLYDFVNNMGVLILGNNHPKVTEAVKTALEFGAGYGGPTELEIELAEIMCEASPCAKKVRFTVSGTEATMTAIRAARAFTGRETVAKFEGHYHGTHDYAQVSTRLTLDKAGSSSAPIATPDSFGIPSAAINTMLILPWNDYHACETLIKRHKRKLAAVMLDPIANASGVIPPTDQFLKGLRECTEENDILLYFDEVLSGFRLAYGGAQEYYGVLPDMATYGKIIGGGFPVGAIAGREDVMQLFGQAKNTEPKIRHLGTFNAHPVTMAAGIATLRELKPEVYQRLNSYAQRIKTEIEAYLADKRITGYVSTAGSFIYLIHFGIKHMTNVRDKIRENKELAWQFAIGAICNGVYLTPAHSNNISSAFSDEDITDAIGRMKGVLEKMDLRS